MINKHPHLLRVSLDFSEPEKDLYRFKELLEKLEKYPMGISEIAIFTNGVHSPFSLREAERRAEILKERMALIKKAGFKSGINHLTTIGHHEEDLENTLGDKYSYMTGENGKVCRGSYCMNDEKFLIEYVKPVYEYLASAEPDFILVDDDIRYGHMPIGNGCFCDICIEKFNKENGFNFTRESLVEKLNSGDVKIRSLWLDKQSKAIENTLKLVAETVRSVNENITLGVMTGERYFEGYRFDKWADALSDGGKYSIMWRPGGGAYTDYRFDEIVEKAEQCGRQNAYLPSYVSERHYEIENFPYQVIKKTPTSTALEAAWAMTSGCTGAAFNILPWESGEPLDTIVPHFKAINKLMPLYNLLSEKVAGKKSSGIITCWHQYSQVSVPEGGFANSYGGIYADFAKEIFDLGFPEAYHPDKAVLTLLKGEFGKCFTDTELEIILSGGVYSDMGAIEYLNSRGFSNLTGFEKGREIPVDAIECYLDHEINEGVVNNKRNCRQAFNSGDSFEVKPISEKATKLTKLVDYHGRTLADCALGIYENEKGGKIAAAGYYPFTWISDYSKYNELKKLILYLTDNKLPSYIDDHIRIRNHTFVDGEKVTVALLNSTNECYENIKVAIKTSKEKALYYNQKGEVKEIKREKYNGFYSFFKLDEIKPYEIILLEA